MTEFASEVSEDALRLSNYPWKNSETILLVVKPHLIDIY